MRVENKDDAEDPKPVNKSKSSKKKNKNDDIKEEKVFCLSFSWSHTVQEQTECTKSNSALLILMILRNLKCFLLELCKIIRYLISIVKLVLHDLTFPNNLTFISASIKR